jgi:hypothetical protein
MKLASGDSYIWLIIAIVFGVAKMWSKFATAQPAEDDEPAPQPVAPRPRPQARPSVPPVAKPPRPTTWQASPEDLRKFMERLTQPSAPKPAASPPIAPPPVPTPAKPTPSAPVAAKTMPPPSRRSSPWVEALRDRQNLRNIIIANEIIGPPRGA